MTQHVSVTSGNIGRILNNQHGVTLLLVLVAVVIIGLTSALAGRTWSTIVRQDKEKELLWRGEQYRRAIGNYYKFGHSGVTGIYPQTFEDLLNDPRSLAPTHHIRQLYSEPITGGPWVIIKNPEGRIIGVRSSSDLEPFKKANFSYELRDLEGKSKYSEWEFTFQPKTKK